MSLGSFYAGRLLLGMWSALVVCLPSEIALEKTKFSFACGYQLNIASGFQVESMCSLFLLTLGHHMVETDQCRT